MSSEKRIMVSDRGRADYFHGRKAGIDFFKETLTLSQEKKKGLSILIQGAPGVGKTALLRELEKIGKEIGWTIATIELEALWNVNELYNCLIDEKKDEKTSKEVHANVQLAGGSMRFNRTKQTVSKTIRAINKPLILVLDEAQMIRVGHTKDSPEMKKVAQLFNQLYNLELEHGLVFLIAGLSDTKSLFKEFKISRFNSDCVINLSTLEKEAEKNILKDDLVQDAHVDEHDPNLNHWIDQMAKETYPWAHPISCYGQVASEKVKTNHGLLSNEWLFEVLKDSRDKKMFIPMVVLLNWKHQKEPPYSMPYLKMKKKRMSLWDLKSNQILKPIR